MAQKLVSFFICDGRFRIHAINAVNRRRGRIIEVEEVDTGARFPRLCPKNGAPSAHLARVGWRYECAPCMDSTHPLLSASTKRLVRRVLKTSQYARWR